MKLSRHLFVVTCIAAVQARAGNWPSVGVDLFHSDSDGDFRPALSLKYNSPQFAESSHSGSLLPWEMYGSAKGELHATVGGGVAMQQSYAEANWVAAMDIKKESSIQEKPVTSPADIMARASSPKNDGFNFGALEFRGHARAETDQKFDNANLTGGAGLHYDTTMYAESKLVPPRLGVMYEYVQPVESDARDAAGASDDPYPRVRAYVLWRQSVSDFTDGPAILLPLALEIHYKYTHELDSPDQWRSAHNNRADWTSVRLIYRMPKDVREHWLISEAYVGYATGREMTSLENDQQVLVGVTAW